MESALDSLEAIEESIATTDRQRLLILRTTDLAVAAVLRDNWPAIRASNGVTLMVARRMFNHYSAQAELKQQIALARMESASGLFQQVVGTYLRAYLGTIDPAFRVELDKRYSQIHPDIAVEKGGKPHWAIEVKTDLGWNRAYISSGDWDKRKQALLECGFSGVHLLILANSNWAGYSPTMEPLGVRVVMQVSPNWRERFKWYKDANAQLDFGQSATADVIHPLEPIFEEIASNQTKANT